MLSPSRLNPQTRSVRHQSTASAINAIAYPKSLRGRKALSAVKIMFYKLFSGALLASFLFLVLISSSEGHQGRSDCGKTCSERVARKQCSQKSVISCIRRAAILYNQSFPDALRVARCESKLDPYARNKSGSTGLFQFLPSTWDTTPYRRRSIYSAKWQSLAAMWMFRQGRKREWVCR